jgi:hypothetical protein
MFSVGRWQLRFSWRFFEERKDTIEHLGLPKVICA